jgi:hypothetical protein
MSRFVYYSPLGVGPLLAVLLNEPLREQCPLWLADQAWLFVGLVGVGAGAAFQVVLVALQGALAHVLPVPGGRSIRGPGAAVGGWLLLLAVVSAVTAGMLRGEELVLPLWAFAGLAGASLLAAGFAYAWCWPTAVADFTAD